MQSWVTLITPPQKEVPGIFFMAQSRAFERKLSRSRFENKTLSLTAN